MRGRGGPSADSGGMRGEDDSSGTGDGGSWKLEAGKDGGGWLIIL